MYVPFNSILVYFNYILKFDAFYRYQGHISAALVLGGVDHTGPYLTCVLPHGSTDSLPYVTMGSYLNLPQNSPGY